MSRSFPVWARRMRIAPSRAAFLLTVGRGSPSHVCSPRTLPQEYQLVRPRVYIFRGRPAVFNAGSGPSIDTQFPDSICSAHRPYTEFEFGGLSLQLCSHGRKDFCENCTKRQVRTLLFVFALLFGATDIALCLSAVKKKKEK